jgi:RNA polymerase sigma-70 factor, ECF subfamily
MYTITIGGNNLMLFPLVIARIDDNDDRAFMENVFLAYRRLMYRVALDYVTSSTEADDVINTACERLYKKIFTIRNLSSSALKPYVVSTTRNSALNYIIAEKKHTSHRDYYSEEAFEKTSTLTEDVEDYVLHRIVIDDVREAIGRLPRREKEVMLMKFFNNMPNTEIAELLGITDNNVRGVLKRAREHIIIDLIHQKRIDVNEIPS